MCQYLQEYGKNSRIRANPEAQGHQSHVLYTRICKHPLQVLRLEYECRCHEHRYQAEHQQYHLGEAGDGYLGYCVESYYPVHGAVEQYARHHRADGRGRLAVRVWEPWVHGRETHLRPVSQQYEDRCELDQDGIELGGAGHQVRPVQGAEL